jgi:hypothetical protein
MFSGTVQNIAQLRISAAEIKISGGRDAYFLLKNKTISALHIYDTNALHLCRVITKRRKSGEIFSSDRKQF